MAKKSKRGGAAVDARAAADSETEQDKKSDFVLVFLPFILTFTSFGLLLLYWLR